MKRLSLIWVSVLFVVDLSACAPAPAAPTITATQVLTATTTTTPTVTPTHAPIPAATSTPLPPIDGKLFFDMNGSGLQDQATFLYDPLRLVDPRQPLQADLDKTIDDYVSAHPDLKKGDLVTVQEPALTGYKVCIKDACATTDSQGRFSIPNASGNSMVMINIIDPNSATPALAMRHINQWKGPVLIEAYEINGKKDPEQHLNDTKIIPINSQLAVKAGDKNEIGLRQGFYTLPMDKLAHFIIKDYVDLDYRIGFVRTYTGKSEGTYDNHQGIDYYMAYGIPLFAMSDGIVQEFDAKPGHVFSIEHKVSPYLYISSYTHNSYTLARQEYPAVYRGQIITLSGSTPSWGEIKPHLHLDNLKIPLTSKNIANPFGYMAIERQKVYYGNHFVPTVDDIYRDLTEPNSLSYWTVDNLPIFPNSQPTP